MTQEERRALAYGLVMTAGFVALDLALGNAAISGSYALGAVVAGVVGGFRPAALVGVIVLVLAVASGAWNAVFGDSGYWARLFVAAAGTLLALGAGRLHDQVAAQLRRQQLLAAVADLPEPGATLEGTVASVVDLLVPRYARFAAIDAGLAGEQVRLAARGTQPVDPATATETRLRARGRDIGALTTTVGRDGIGDPEFLRVLSGRIALALDNAGLSQQLVTVEQRLQAILENLGEAVTVQDRTGRLVFANHAAAELLGAESVEELLATPPAELVERFVSVTPDGRPLDPQALPGRAVLEGRSVEPLTLRTINKLTGEERWRITKSTPVRSPSGDVLLAVNVIEDITETKRAELAQRLLADAGAALASAVDFEQTLQHVADLAVPAVADWCAIYTPSGTLLERVALADGAAPPAIAEDALPLLDVLRGGKPELLSARDWLESALVAPMTTAERVVGVLALATTTSGRRLSDADVDLALELGRRCATAIENARLYNQLEHVATTLQHSLLPPRLPDVPGWSFGSLYMPAGEETDVGGDFYDVFQTAAGWTAVMGDVVGRGPAAASLTAMGRYTLRTAGALVGAPTLGLARLNENLRERGDLALCTVALVQLKEGGHEANLVCAGHPLPLLVRGGSAHQVGRIGPLLGAFEHGHWPPAQLELLPGDVIVLYTDGVIDARGADGRFGEERLQEAVAPAESARDAVDRIRRALAEFAGGEQDDDTAVLAMQKL